MKFSYNFPAVRGLQAEQDYYIAMVPLGLLSKLFPSSDEDFILPEHRAQRCLNELRIPQISEYILQNRSSYVFSALAASIDGAFTFAPSEISEDIGILEVDLSAVFLINDGQHRKAAIEAAIVEDPSLANETISIVFFKDRGLVKSQQMFTDLNKHAVKTSNSLATLYDSRDPLAVCTLRLIDTNKFFRKYTDKEKDNLGKNAQKFFTLMNIYKANQKILRNNCCDEKFEAFLEKYWLCVSKNVVPWQEMDQRILTKKDLRENYIVTLNIVIQAFGKLGAYFYDHQDMGFDALEQLQEIDWSRSNADDWEGRTINKNKVNSSEAAINLTCAKLKVLLGLKLSKEELKKEKELKKHV